MEKGDGKPWERPWSTDKIREQSTNWNLAGDSGLLHNLQQFSETLLTRTHETEVSVNQLMEDMKTSSTEIENVMNTFLALANTQFVENRVYDDDEKETPPEEKKEIEKVKTKEEHEAMVVEKVKEAIQLGMTVLDTHFDAVEVPACASDSEEEESSASVGRIVLKPRNMYATRPLPYIIGSQEFMEDDKVGLGDLSSDTEDSRDQNIMQSSESDEEIEHDDAPIVAKRIKMASSSDSENSEPESDRGGSIVRPKAHRKTNANTVRAVEDDEGDMFGQESPPEADVLPTPRVSLPSALTDELSAKLGGGKRETSTPRPKRDTDNMFEPPPEPEEEKSLFGYSSGPFSGGRGLFDDLDDWNAASNSLWKADEDSPQKVPEKIPRGPEEVIKQPQAADKMLFGNNDEGQGLFDDSQEDDLFSTSNQKSRNTISEILSRERRASRKENIEPGSREGSVFSEIGKTSDSQEISGSPGSFGGGDGDDDLFSASSVSSSSQDTSKRKKLPGAVPVFSDVNLFGDKAPSLSNRKASASSDDVKRPSKVASEPSPKAVNAAASDSHRTDNHILKEPESNHNAADDLFNSLSVTVKKKTSSLFGEDNEDESDGLFSKPKTTVGSSKNVSTTKPGGIASTGAKPKKAISLFDDSDSGDDELLFSSTSSTSSRSRRSQASGDVLAAPIERKILPKKGLDDLFFGVSTQEEPDFDIFNSKQSSKAKPSSIKEEANNGSSAEIGASLGGTRVRSGLFDDIDEVDDIFVITKKSHETIVPSSTISAPTKSKSSLFFDNSDETDDIFSSEPLFSSSAGISVSKNISKIDNKPKPVQDTEDIFSSESLVIEKDLAHESSNISTNVPLLDNKGLLDDEEGIFPSKPLASLEVNGASAPATKPVRDNHLEIDDIFTSKSFVSDKDESSHETKPALEAKEVNTGGSEIPKMKPSISQKPVIIRKPGSVPPPTTKLPSKPNVPERNENSQEEFPRLSTQVSPEVQSGAEKVVADGTAGEPPPVSSSKPDPPRTLNIRKTTDVLFGSPSHENDLFDSSWSENTEEKKLNVDKPLKGAVSSNSFGALLRDYETAAEETSTYIRGSPAREKPVGKITGAMGDDVEAERTERSTTKVSKLSPGKLIIDPTALLPGAKHPGHPRTPETGVGFDKPVETSGMLHSAGKERVKIQVKRRPQSRRARQEALRASSADYDNLDTALISQTVDDKNDSNADVLLSKRELSVGADDLQVPTDTEDSQITVSDDIFETTSAHSKLTGYLEANSNPLSPSTDEEDLFAVPQELPYDQPQEYRNMFGGAPVLSPVDSKPEVGSIFEPSEPKTSEGADEAFGGKLMEKGDMFVSVDRSKIGATLPYEIESSENIPPDIFSKSSKENSEPHAFSKDRSHLLSDKLNSDDSDEDLFSSLKRRTHDKKVKTQDKQSFLAEDFSLFPSQSSEILDGQKSAARSKDLFTPQEEEIDRLFMSKTIGDSQKDFQKTPDILRSIDVSDDFLSKQMVENDKHTKSQTDSLFGEGSGGRDVLFGSGVNAPKKSAPSSSVKLGGGSLFEDTGEDDDIFTSHSLKSSKSKVMPASSENLFSGSADDDADLFSSRPSSGRSQKTKQLSVQKKQPTEEIFEDPLMVVKK